VIQPFSASVLRLERKATTAWFVGLFAGEVDSDVSAAPQMMTLRSMNGFELPNELDGRKIYSRGEHSAEPDHSSTGDVCNLG
jgi:hypothetical protein